MKTLKQVLMERDGMSESEALDAIQDARNQLRECLDEGGDPSNICEELFGLEPDYLDELF